MYCLCESGILGLQSCRYKNDVPTTLIQVRKIHACKKDIVEENEVLHVERIQFGGLVTGRT